MGQNFSESPGNIVAAFSSATAPTVNDDSGDGFVIGSMWVDTATNTVYACTSNTLGAAIWVSTRSSGARYAYNPSSGGVTGGFNTVHVVTAIGADDTVDLPQIPNTGVIGSVIIVKRGAGSDSAVIVRPPPLPGGLVHIIDGVAGKEIHLLEPEETVALVLGAYPPGGPLIWNVLAIDSYSHNRNTYLTASLGSPMEFGRQYVFDMATATANLTASLPAITANNIGKKISVKRVNSGTANVFSVVVNRNGTDRIDYVNTASRTIDGDDAHLIFESSINGLVNSWIVE